MCDDLSQSKESIMAGHPQQSPPSQKGRQRPEWLNWDSYPFEVRTLGSPTGDIAFIDEGDGPPLLFVHVGMWSFVWRDVIVRLPERYRCIAIDAPGSGLSSAPTTGAPSIADAANAVDQVVRHLALNDMALVFHDLGGPASLLAAGNWPDRVRLLVAVNTASIGKALAVDAAFDGQCSDESPRQFDGLVAPDLRHSLRRRASPRQT
jgi:pimeloyl-ACP methyl ester carboxylesterase